MGRRRRARRRAVYLSKGLWRGAGESFFLGSGQSQLLKQITTTAFIFRPQWLPQPSSAFFGLLRAFHAATLHHTAKRRLDHIQQPTDWRYMQHPMAPQPLAPLSGAQSGSSHHWKMPRRKAWFMKSVCSSEFM